AIAGDELTGAEDQVLVRMDADVDSTGDGQSRSPVLEVEAGEVNGGQGGRAHRIQRHAGPMEIEHIRDAVGDARSAAGDSDASSAGTGVGSKQLIFAVHHPDIHADLPG